MINDNPCPLCEHPFATGTPLSKNKTILDCLQDFRDKKQEYLVCISLDSGQKLISRRIVTIGLLNTALAHPREIYAAPLMERADTVIIAHNHPSGDPTPSKQDIQITQQIIAAGQLLGIPLRDHIIIAVKSHYSFLEHGMI